MKIIIIKKVCLKVSKLLMFFFIIASVVSFGGITPFGGNDTTDIEGIVTTIKNPQKQWRKDANKRIEKYRKVDINIKVVDENSGEVIKDAKVNVKLLKHDFHFGGILRSPSFREDEQSYKSIFLNMGFNAAGFNNSLKYKLWRGQKRFKPEEIIKWLRSQDIYMRGHCLIWPGLSHLPNDFKKILKAKNSDAGKKNIEKYCHDMVKSWVQKWDVDEWDVMNEPRGNHLVQDILGKRVEADWFKIAKKYSKNRDARLFLNDNRIISDPGSKKLVTSKVNGKKISKIEWHAEVKSKKMLEYYNNVKELLKNGAPINGLGFQSRFGTMISAEVIYDRLDLFAKFNMPIVATEFEMKTSIGKEIDKAIMTERVMTTYFSHRLVDGIYAWTLAHDDKGRQIINSKGLPNLRGKVWLYLTKNIWNTNETVLTNKDGLVNLRGFKGKYKVDVTNPKTGKVNSIELNLTKNNYTIIKI